MVQLSLMDGYLTDPLPEVSIRERGIGGKSWRHLGNGYCIWQVLRDDGVVKVYS